MAFTAVTLTGTVELSPGVACPQAVVTVKLSAPITDGTTDLAPSAQAATADGSGVFSLGPVPANDDSTTSPVGTFYSVTVATSSGRVLDTFSVVVPSASAPSVSLFSLARLGTMPAAASPFVETFNGRNGAVDLTKADVTGTGLAAADVGADVDGAAATVQTNLNAEVTRAETAESTNAAAIAAETARAETAEALLASLQDPLQIGQPSTVVPSATMTGIQFGGTNWGSYSRLVAGGYSVSYIGVQVSASSGNVSVAAYSRSGSGANATPTGGRLATSGAVPCPAAGLAEISLGAAITPNIGDWFGMSVDNVTAVFACVASSAGFNLGAGFTYTQSAAHPLPAIPSSLTGNRMSVWLKGF